jgi:hypothetical protein
MSRRDVVVVRIVAVLLAACCARPASIDAAGCPTSVRFEPTASGTLDAGWTGISHALPIFGTVPELGTPTTTDDYALCLYDASGGRAFQIPAAGTCRGRPCWQAKPTGFTYRNKDAAPDGIVQVDLRGGGDGKARAAVRGQGGMLSLPPLTSLSSTIIVQLRNRTTGFCLGTSFVPPFDRSTPQLLKDRAD